LQKSIGGGGDQQRGGASVYFTLHTHRIVSNINLWSFLSKFPEQKSVALLVTGSATLLGSNLFLLYRITLGR